MPKSREDFDSDEAFAQHRLGLARQRRDKALEDLAEQAPYVAWAKRAMALEEAAMWERIRTEFPNQKHWAANLAAHSWVIKLEGDHLYAISRSYARVSVADAPPVAVEDFPICCVACKHRQTIHFKKTAWLAHCVHHRHDVFDHHVCEDYERKT